LLSHKDEIWSEEAEPHVYEAGQVMKMPNYENPQYSGRQYFENGYTYVSEPRIVQS